MKAKRLVLLPFVVFTTALSSCQKAESSFSIYGPNGGATLLTYGTYLVHTIDDLKELNTDELSEKANAEEVFLLAVYQGEYSETCHCWTTFKSVVASYVDNYHEQIYLYNAHNQDETISDLKIKKVSESTPMLYIFKGKEQIGFFSYSSKKNKNIFEDTTGKALNEKVHQVVGKPKMYYIDETKLDELKESSTKTVVMYMRNGCGDCKYTIPNVIIPYITNNYCNSLYLFDMQYYYDLAKYYDSESSLHYEYDRVKEKYQLTQKSNANHGYLNGVVPTFHCYQSGQIVGSSVYFNDVISQKEDGSYYISDSFYSEDRLTSNRCYAHVNTNVLKGMAINNEDVITTASGYAYWSQEKAALYHTPLLKAFLDVHLINYW